MTLYQRALQDLAAVFERLDHPSVDAAVSLIAASQRVVVYGVGREGLQLRGLAMRLYHLGLRASVVGDMACPPVGAGDLLVVSAGPGEFSTVLALMHTARDAGAMVLAFTAQPDGRCGREADASVTVPAQTMADDQGGGSVLPMGSLYEAALALLFEVIVLKLRERLAVPADTMRARHTNLE